MNRRKFLTTAAATPLAAVPLMSKRSIPEQIEAHLLEAWRLLLETMPEGHSMPAAHVVGGDIIAACFPAGYQSGQAHAQFKPGIGWTYST